MGGALLPAAVTGAVTRSVVEQLNKKSKVIHYTVIKHEWTGETPDR